MKAGADLAAISMHKSGGSLTQSSILLTNNGMNADYVQTIINITQTTSASYLLMTSLIYQEEILPCAADSHLQR